MRSSTPDSNGQNSPTSNALQAPNEGFKDKSAKSKELKNDSKSPKQTNGKANNSSDEPRTSQLSTDLLTKQDESLIKPINTREEFDKLVETIKDKYILVWFSAVWCGPCKSLALKFNELAHKYRQKIEILQIDVDNLEDLALENEVSTMPAYMIMRNGQKLAHYVGSKQDHIDDLVEKYLEQKSGG